MTFLKTTALRIPVVGALCLLLLTVSYATNAMDRIVLPMLLKWISAEYGFDIKLGGFLATVFALGAGVAAWPAGWLLDRWSRKIVLVLGMLIYSVFTGATVISSGFADMAFYRFLTGIGEAMQLAALFTIVCSYFPKNKALMVGIVNLGFGFGNIIGPIAAIRLMGAHSNWRAPFIAYTLIGLAFAVLILATVPKRFTEAARSSRREVALIKPGTAFLNRNVLLCGIVATCWGFCTFSHVGLYATFLMTELKLEPTKAGVAVSAMGAGGLFGFLGGWFGDRYSNLWSCVGGWMILAVLWYLQYHVVGDGQVQTLLNFFVGLGITSILHPNAVALLQRSVPDAFIGRATGFFHTCAYLAAGFAGLGFGTLVRWYDWGIAADVILLGLPLVAIASLLSLAVNDNSRMFVLADGVQLSSKNLDVGARCDNRPEISTD
jgi:predicted MFS family arabinose efflux permease